MDQSLPVLLGTLKSKYKFLDSEQNYFPARVHVTTCVRRFIIHVPMCEIFLRKNAFHKTRLRVPLYWLQRSETFIKPCAWANSITHLFSCQANNLWECIQITDALMTEMVQPFMSAAPSNAKNAFDENRFHETTVWTRTRLHIMLCLKSVQVYIFYLEHYTRKSIYIYWHVHYF